MVRVLSGLLAVAAASTVTSAKGHKSLDPAQDQISVLGQVPLNQDVISTLTITEHYGHDYVYAQSASGKSLTVIDVTNARRPAVWQSALGSNSGSTKVVAAAGTAALVGDTASATESAPKSQTFRIISFADPTHPVIQREFDNVTAVAEDPKRSLIFVANPQGVWILHQEFALDPQVEREWEHMMLDNH
jgi:hypothetical protein